MFPRLFQNRLPAQATHGGDGVAEGRLLLGVPESAESWNAPIAPLPSEDQAHQAEQTQQTRRGASRRAGVPLRPVAWRGKPQVSAHFLERDLDAPAAREEAGDPLRPYAGGEAVAGFGA